MNDRQGLHPKLFPTPNTPNLLICTPGIGSKREFTAIITNLIPCLDIVEKSQCFPLNYYEPATQGIIDFNAVSQEIIDGYRRRSGITDEFHEEVSKKYNIGGITKEDIFYYIYGIFHSADYREKFSVELKKSLARIPLVKTIDDFRAFRNSGWRLSRLHLTYDDPAAFAAALVEISEKQKHEKRAPQKFDHIPIDIEIDRASAALSSETLYCVEKMRYAKSGPRQDDKTQIVYNSHITLKNIPIQAQDYIVNGKSALDWLIERYAVTTDTKSQITNDPNKYAPDNPKYILDILQTVTTLSVHTQTIADSLPPLTY